MTSRLEQRHETNPAFLKGVRTTGCIKKCPEYKIASKLVYLQNYGYQQQPTANIGLQVCISVNFVFICSIL